MTTNDIVLNILLCSIPEEIFIVAMALIFMKRFDYIDKYLLKINLIKVLSIVVVPSAILSNIMVYVLHINENLNLIINILSMVIMICILLKTKKVFKVVMYLLFSVVVFMIIQLTTVGMIFYVLSLDGDIINQSAIMNFKLTLPGRIIEFTIIYLIYLKKNSMSEFKIMKVWMGNFPLRITTIIYSIINIFICMIIYSSFINNNSLKCLLQNTQILIVTIIFVLLILNFMLPWIIILTIYPSERYRSNVSKKEN
ncbi:hypothetical protein [Clostridium cylindrosporum]|uniref:Uncharacterized protein n=1 Tax=Clostridium cylindrosporum DSM 605 TaxID=1121307 RepID=A0A0J8G5I6_CLOCY|nr:hypothetical protein [Clostridium cylindrosporum]KMT22916.1 hypothetical protein CLCY_5c01550 [Clostridium cylindrosporum DSM 605]